MPKQSKRNCACFTPDGVVYTKIKTNRDYFGTRLRKRKQSLLTPRHRRDTFDEPQGRRESLKEIYHDHFPIEMKGLLDITNALSLIENHFHNYSHNSSSKRKVKNQKKFRHKRETANKVEGTTFTSTMNDPITKIIQEIQTTLETLEVKFLEHELNTNNLTRGIGIGGGGKSPSKAGGGGAGKLGAKCFIESETGKVNCSNVIYEDEKTWRKSRGQIDLLIKVLKEKINHLKEIKKQLKENKSMTASAVSPGMVIKFDNENYDETGDEILMESSTDNGVLLPLHRPNKSGKRGGKFEKQSHNSRPRKPMQDEQLFDFNYFNSQATDILDTPHLGGGNSFGNHSRRRNPGHNKHHSRWPTGHGGTEILTTTTATTIVSSFVFSSEPPNTTLIKGGENQDISATTLSASSNNSAAQSTSSANEVSTNFNEADSSNIKGSQHQGSFSSRTTDPSHREKFQFSGPAECYCEPENENDHDEKELAREARRKLKEERQRKKERKRIKKARMEKECLSEKMNCFSHDNSHWRTAPLWNDSPFCFCMNANNNTYSCIRTINATHDFLYCEFTTGLITYYNLRIDPFETLNQASSLTMENKSYMHDALDRLKSCRGKGCTLKRNHLPLDSLRVPKRNQPGFMSSSFDGPKAKRRKISKYG